MTSVTVLPSGDVPGAELVWTIVVAGGTGQRFGAAKQYEPLDERRRVIDVSRQVAERASDGVVVVVPPADAEREHGVAGGATRSESVRAGLAAIRAGADGAIPGIAVTDTIKVVDGSDVTATLDRTTLVAVQTPQAFRAAMLRAAHGQGGSATDDAALVEAMGGRVVVVAGEATNRKIDEIEWARRTIGAAR